MDYAVSTIGLPIKVCVLIDLRCIQILQCYSISCYCGVPMGHLSGGMCRKAIYIAKHVVEG